MIEVRLFATLREDRGKVLHVNAEDFNNGQDLIDHFKIDTADVAIFLINGIHSKLEDEIKDNDIIAIFPPVGGG